MIQVHKAIVSCSFLLALTVAASAQPVSIATTPAGSFTNSAGAAIAKVISEKTGVRAVIQAQAMQGQVPVDAGSADFGIHGTVYFPDPIHVVLDGNLGDVGNQIICVFDAHA